MGILDFINPVKAVAGAIKGVADAVFGGIDKLSTTEEEKMTLRNAAQVAFEAFNVQMATLAVQLEKESAGVIKTEIQEGGWLGRSWRPLLMLTFGAVIVYATIAPALGAPPVDMSGVPERMWVLMTVGVGGYVAGRTAEKIIPNSKWGKGA